MLTCTFFGHKDTPEEIGPLIRSRLIDLIIKNNVTNFYVGNQGNFDRMVKNILGELKKIYAINYAVVLAYLNEKKDDFNKEDQADTLFPDGIEDVPLRFAINYRNKWMIEQSDYVLTYVKYTVGGAAKFKELAEKRIKQS